VGVTVASKKIIVLKIAHDLSHDALHLPSSAQQASNHETITKALTDAT